MKTKKEKKEDNKDRKEDFLEKLQKIADLKQRGIITGEEFEMLKSGYLKKFSNEYHTDHSSNNDDNKPSSTKQHAISGSNNFLIYENPTFGIKIGYPSNWEGTEIAQSLYKNTIRIVQFN